MKTPQLARDPVGLCRQCRFAQAVTSSRGSEFWLCGRSEKAVTAADLAEFPKYPRLPVLVCRGYEQA